MDASDLTRRIIDNLNFSPADAPELLDDDAPKADLWPEIKALLQQPNEAFVRGMYLLLVRRPADGPGLAAYCEALGAGMDRAYVIQALALSDAARDEGVDVTWIPRLDEPLTPLRLFSLKFLRKAIRRVMAVRPRGAWARIKRGVRRLAS